MPETFLSDPVSADVRHNVFMAVKESLNNIVKHSGALKVVLAISEESENVLISIEDDGNGFDPANLPTFSNGVTNLSKRMEEIGGTCAISSEIGKGTTVSLRVPIRRNQRVG